MPNPNNEKIQGGAAAKVYIIGSEDGSLASITAALADGSEVTLAAGAEVALAAGENYIGRVGGPGTTLTVTPTVTAGAYVADDVVGGRLEFAGAARAAGLGGVIIGATIIDDAGQDSEMELWFFNAQPDDIADNAAFAPTEADLHDLAGSISTADGSWRAAGTPSAVYIDTYVRYDPDSGTSIYAFLVDRTGGTLVATDDITVILHVLQD